MDQKHTVTLYSSQRDEVVDLIEKEAVYFVKMRFIREKYEEVAEVFLTAYRTYVQNAPQYVPKPDEAESAVWAFPDLRNLDRVSGYKLLTLEVPKEDVIFFDMLEWSDILNFRYIGEKEDAEAFRDKLRRQGVTEPMDIITTPFYPLLKRELQDSWKNLFRFQDEIKIGRPTPSGHVQAGLWQIKKEWILSIE